MLFTIVIYSSLTELFLMMSTGDLHWKNVFVYLNKVGQVTIKLQSKHMRGALTTNKKSEL